MTALHECNVTILPSIMNCGFFTIPERICNSRYGALCPNFQTANGSFWVAHRHTSTSLAHANSFFFLFSLRPVFTLHATPLSLFSRWKWTLFYLTCKRWIYCRNEEYSFEMYDDFSVDRFGKTNYWKIKTDVCDASLTFVVHGEKWPETRVWFQSINGMFEMETNAIYIHTHEFEWIEKERNMWIVTKFDLFKNCIVTLGLDGRPFLTLTVLWLDCDYNALKMFGFIAGWKSNFIYTQNPLHTSLLRWLLRLLSFLQRLYTALLSYTQIQMRIFVSPIQTENSHSHTKHFYNTETDQVMRFCYKLSNVRRTKNCCFFACFFCAVWRFGT